MKKNNHTFVVCAYKESPYLEECIQSLLDQTLKSKILVVSSTPNEFIRQICTELDVPFSPIRGGGIGNDWNAALNEVDTQYATIAHQDDIYLPDYLNSVFKELDNSGINLLSFSGYKEIVHGEVSSENINLVIKKILLLPIKFFPSSVHARRFSLSFGNGICCPSVTYNLNALENFIFDSKLKVNLDWDAWERISKMRGNFSYVSSPLMLHRIHTESETTKRIEDNHRTSEDTMIFERFWPKPMVRFLMYFYSKSQNSNN